MVSASYTNYCLWNGDRKMKTIRHKVLFIAVALITVVSALVAGIYIVKVWSPSRFSLSEDRTSSEQVRSMVKPILMEKLLGEIGRPPDGDEEWYKLLLSEKDNVSSLSPDDRLDFFAIIMLNVEFSAESIDTYLHMIRADARSLSNKLSLFEKSDRFHSLNEVQREKLLMLNKKANAIYETGDL